MALLDTAPETLSGGIPPVEPEARPQRPLFRVFDSRALKKALEKPLARHTEFLRTGRIQRHRDSWDSVQKRYLTWEEMEQRTARKLEAAGETSYERINGFHKSIRFPKVIFHRTLANYPFLGYCHVTASTTKLTEESSLNWAFYLANFNSDIGENMSFTGRKFEGPSRMYFAVALELDPETRQWVFDKKRGVIFKTTEPRVALKNVLTLGTTNRKLREIIASL